MIDAMHDWQEIVVKLHRFSSKLKIKSLAEELGLSRPTLYKILRGELVGFFPQLKVRSWIRDREINKKES